MIKKALSRISFIVLIFTLIILTLNFSSPGSNQDWELVYENNSDGRKTSGDIDNLISFALNGSDVKVILHFDSADLHYQMKLSKVKVDICDRIVTGYNYDFRQNTKSNNVYSRISTYSTNGEYISTYEENNFYRNPELIKVSMSWYVNN